MHVKKIVFVRITSTVLMLGALFITAVFVPTSFILREYPDESEFDIISRIYLMNATGTQCQMMHLNTRDASFIPPKLLLPHFVYMRKKALQGSVQIAVGKPSARIETFSTDTAPADKTIQWYVLDGKVVGFSVLNNGVQTDFDVIVFTKTACQWVSFLKAAVDDTPDKGVGKD